MELIRVTMYFLIRTYVYHTSTQHTILEAQTSTAYTPPPSVSAYNIYIQLQKFKKFISTISDIQMTSESIQS